MFERIKEYRRQIKMENILYIYVNHIQTQLIVTYSELSRNLFPPAESTTNIKVIIIRRGVIGDGYIWEEISPMNAC